VYVNDATVYEQVRVFLTNWNLKLMKLVL